MKALLAIVLVALMAGVTCAEEYGLYVVDSKQKCFDQDGSRLAQLCIVEEHDEYGRIIHAKVIYNSTGGTVISPSILLDELFEASEEILPYLNAPSDRMNSIVSVTLEYKLPPNEIELAEREVERLKKKDAAILRFRKALQAVQ